MSMANNRKACTVHVKTRREENMIKERATGQWRFLEIVEIINTIKTIFMPYKGPDSHADATTPNVCEMAIA